MLIVPAGCAATGQTSWPPWGLLLPVLLLFSISLVADLVVFKKDILVLGALQAYCVLWYGCALLLSLSLIQVPPSFSPWELHVTPITHQ